MIPEYQEVEKWHLIDQIKIHKWLDEMLKKKKPIPETITEMKKRHWEEEKQLRNNCKHFVKSLIKKDDASDIGFGGLYSRKDIICKFCGTKKMIFSEKDWKGIEKTMKKTKLKDERFGFITHAYEVEED